MVIRMFRAAAGNWPAARLEHADKIMRRITPLLRIFGEAAEGFFGRLKNEFFYGRDWRGVTAEEFMERLDAWLRFYCEERLKLFVEADGRKVYDTIGNHRRRLGLAA